MMRKKAFALMLVFIIALMSAGCSSETAQDGGNDTPGQNQEGQNSQLQENTEGQSVVIKQYFGSSAYVYDGQDEVNGELMPPVEYKLEYKEGDNVYLEAVNSLRNLPEGQSQYCTMLDKNYVCNGVTVEDGVAYVDFSSEGLNGGSINEIVLIDQIVYTLSNSFEDVAAVQFTVDGEKTDTLMGHMDTSEAFVADYL
ncbi:MAG: GerMN domain-containing protein [Bacillota bacterium]|nr:GerMN domain-containing protein [Bacillota bacterium]